MVNRLRTPQGDASDEMKKVFREAFVCMNMNTEIKEKVNLIREARL